MEECFGDSLNFLSNLTTLYTSTPNIFGYTGSTTLETDHVTVAKSLQTTRFVVQSILTPIIVTIGLLGNVLNILVLFQPSMRTSTNVYLLVLSLADSVYLVFNLALSLLDCRKRGMSYISYRFNPYGRFVSNFSGNMAVWVTVVFTVERYIAVCHPIHGKVWCTVSRAKLASLSTAVLALINTVPTAFELEVYQAQDGPRCRYTELAQRYSYEVIYSWWYVALFTIVPLIFLAIFNIVLIRALVVANRKREQLTLSSSHPVTNGGTNSSGSSSSIVMRHRGIRGKGHELTYSCTDSPYASSTTHLSNSNNSSIKHPASTKTETSTAAMTHVPLPALPKSPNVSTHKRQCRRFSREQNKVTLLLVTIVMIFLVCQLPWTALFLYQTYLSSNDLPGSSTDMKIAGNICNVLALFNASGNFYLYSCFSRRFRRTLAKLVMCWRPSHTPLPATV